MYELPDLGELEFHLQTPVHCFHQYQGNTNDCGPTSLAIAANAFLGEVRFQGSQVAAALNNWRQSFPRLVVPRFHDRATFPWGIVQYLRQFLIPARWGMLGTTGRLQQNLLADRITIVMVGEPFRWQGRRCTAWAHAKVLFGYSPGSGYVFVDSGHEKDVSSPDPWQRCGLFWQDEAEFVRQWRNLLKIYVEVGNLA